jgi:hypothetical protein
MAPGAVPGKAFFADHALKYPTNCVWHGEYRNITHGVKRNPTPVVVQLEVAPYPDGKKDFSLCSK